MYHINYLQQRFRSFLPLHFGADLINISELQFFFTSFWSVLLLEVIQLPFISNLLKNIAIHSLSTLQPFRHMPRGSFHPSPALSSALAGWHFDQSAGGLLLAAVVLVSKRNLTYLDLVHPFFVFHFFKNFLPTSVSSSFLKLFNFWQVFHFLLFYTLAHTCLSFTSPVADISEHLVICMESVEEQCPDILNPGCASRSVRVGPWVLAGQLRWVLQAVPYLQLSCSFLWIV